MAVGTQFEVLEVVSVAGQGCLAEVHNIGTVPLAVLRGDGIGDRPVGEILTAAVGR